MLLEVAMVDINQQRQCNAPGLSHHQNIHFLNGESLLIQNVQFIWEKRWTHIIDAVGVEYVINPKNVTFFERVPVRKEKKHGKSGSRSKKRPKG